jgi:putative membrane-bound dehydrogenase-like protein
MQAVRSVLILTSLCVPSVRAADFSDKQADGEALPTVPAAFEVTVFARDPLVRQPCSMAFDAKGRLFVGMGPQYRNPTPETPGDSVVIVLDSDGDGRADQTRVFATGFNAVQGLAWHGRDLWVANSPDLTVVRDLDGDDEADEYVRVYTDLGNLEHGLHGLTWAPDGKLYMSKGNSKGLTLPGRAAPKPFRDLWGVTAIPGTPDFPAPQVFRKQDYQHAYHDPADDWGMDGGVLCCDDGGTNLEIVSRGFRNPWDIALDDGFNMLGTDNDQTTGDRVFMPFYSAHFGWNHPWSSHWSTAPHLPTAPVSGPLFEGSGTGVVFGNSPQFPPMYRNVFFINDWLRKTTFVWRPDWDGAVMRPRGGDWEPFIVGGNSLFRPTDIEFGPDGALWVLGWSSGYGAEWKDDQLTNEGRIFRIAWKEHPPVNALVANNGELLRGRTVTDLIDDFSRPLPVCRIDAQDELVRRGPQVRDSLVAVLESRRLSRVQETWTAWSLGRIAIDDITIDQFFGQLLADGSDAPAALNLRIQAVRILGDRSRRGAVFPGLDDALRRSLTDNEPRVRMAAVQALLRAERGNLHGELCSLLESESDVTVFYAGWQALRRLLSTVDLRSLLDDPRGPVQRAALLALLETHSLSRQEVAAVHAKPISTSIREIAELWLAKAGGEADEPIVRGRPIDVRSASSAMLPNEGVAVVGRLSSKSRHAYRIQPGGLRPGIAAYTDRGYRFSTVPNDLVGLDLIQTANDDDGSRGEDGLSMEALLPVRVFVGNDLRQTPPQWLRDRFRRTEQIIVIDEGSRFQLYASEFPAGQITLGGNTDDGKSGGKGNYIVAVMPSPLERQKTTTSVEQALMLMESADSSRGEVLFRHAGGAGCFKCHSLDASQNAFGPNLSGVGLRVSHRHLVQSIIEPSAVITEGFTMQTVLTDAGKTYSGVLLEESGLSVSLGMGTGERVDIPKSQIEERSSSGVSAMPSMADSLSPQQVADIATFLAMQKTAVSKSSQNPDASFSVKEQEDQLIISLSGQQVAQFVYADPKLLRPYFAQVRTPSGRQVTRNHPPIASVDSTDHDAMHPGIWLAFGDVSGHDFWRNKGRIEHLRFTERPIARDNSLTFATQSRLVGSDGGELCRMASQFELQTRPAGWRLIWDATFQSDVAEFSFGDQEEMGFGARVATPLIERNGGVITSSTGQRTAATTWGQSATWCDYSGRLGDHPAGVMLIPGQGNFRESWWHNRDYGVFIANPFGRAAMKQGEKSTHSVSVGQPFRIRFTAVIHEGREFDPAAEFRATQGNLDPLQPPPVGAKKEER